MVWLWVPVGLAAAVFAYASLLERNWYALRRHRVPCLAPGSAPLRLLHLSDLHLRAVQRRKQRWLRALARLEPDLVVGTGDFLGDPSPETARVAAEVASSIPARLGAVYVLGSNDFYGPVFKNPLRYLARRRRPPSLAGPRNAWEDLVAGLREHGWHVLTNERARLEGTDVVGLGDAHIGMDDPSVAEPGGTAGDFRLAVAHSPDSAFDLAPLGYDLIVCGHTHGGQVCVPGVGALVTNSRLPRAMARGLHEFGGTWLHVNAGLGTSLFAPYRFWCRPEACLLELVPRDEEPQGQSRRAARTRSNAAS